MERDMDYIDREIEQMQVWDADRLRREIVNKELNEIVAKFADYEDDEGDGMRVPYMGWYWRDVDFAGADPYITIGTDGTTVAFMENNKWGYPERRLLPEEVATVRRLVCEAREAQYASGDIIDNVKAKLRELGEYVSGLAVGHDGWWVVGFQGRVSFSTDELDARRMAQTLSESAPGLPAYRVERS